VSFKFATETAESSSTKLRDALLDVCHETEFASGKSSDEFTSEIASFLKHLDITMKRLQLKQSNVMHRKTQHRMQG